MTRPEHIQYWMTASAMVAITVLILSGVLL